MSFRPKVVRVKRYSLEGVDRRLLELPVESGALSLPGADWLPGDVHELEVDADGGAQVVATDQRGRPARVPLFNGRALSFRSAPQVAQGDCVSFGATVTASFLAAEFHDPALEARLADDLEARAVYADALEEAGDPLGEAIALAGPDGAPPSWVLHETRLPLLEVDVSWKSGFAEQAQVSLLESAVYPAGILRVLHARVFAALRSLTVRIDVARAIERPLDERLAVHLPASLREFQLIVGQREAPPRDEVDALLDRVRAQCPAVEATVTVDPSRAEPSVERMHFNLRGKQ